MKTVETVAALEALYDATNPRALTKVVQHITPLYRQWIAASRFMVLSTVGPEGTDGSPRGDDGPVVDMLDDKTILIPDWRGNNRLDSLRNIVRDGRLSLMFMVPGESNVVRVNGTAVLTADEDMTSRFTQSGKHPRTVIVMTVAELYFQCAKSIMRSRLWAGEGSGEGAADLPTAGAFLKERDALFDGDAYDETYAEYAKSKMW